MYRALLCFAFLAFCSGAPFTDVNSVQSFPVQQDQQFMQPSMTASNFQQDETDLVDTLGAGYAYFKKQPIVSRPLAQQKLAIHEQRVPLTSLDDTSNQWSDYTRASAFKQLPVPPKLFTVSKDVLESDYGQSTPDSRPKTPVIPIPTESEITQPELSVTPKTVISEDQGTYGSGLSQDLSKMLPTTIQQRPLSVFQQPFVRTLEKTFNRPELLSVVENKRPFIRNFETSFLQQDMQPMVQDQRSFKDASSMMRNFETPSVQRDMQPMVQDQRSFSVSSPMMRNFETPSVQQDMQPMVQDQRPVQVVQPWMRNLGNSFVQKDMQPSWEVKPNKVFDQRMGSTFNDFTTESRFGHKLPSKVVFPSVRTAFTQSQPAMSSAQFSQPSWSFQQSDLPPRSHSIVMPSSRFGVPSQSKVPMSDSTSFSGW